MPTAAEPTPRAATPGTAAPGTAARGTAARGTAASSSPAPARARSGLAVDVALGGALAVGTLAALLATVSSLGYARDEGFYFQAAEAYGTWFDLLLREPGVALQRAAVDRHWGVNHEHPALVKSLFALSRRVLHERAGWFAEAGTAHRFPAMVMSALAVSLVFAWGRRAAGRRAGLIAALLFILMPRVFYHAHLACFDLPAAAMYLATTFALVQSLEARGRGALAWGVATGVLFGLYLDTKHNAWTFPALAFGLTALAQWDWLRQRPRSRPWPVPWALCSIVLLGPGVLVAAWPWLWFDTSARLAEWVRFHTQHDYYNMEFLGVTYWKPPLPRLYAWVMTFATVPAITLLLALLGSFAAMSQELGVRGSALGARFGATVGVGLGRGPSPAAVVSGRFTRLAWLLALLLAYAPWWSSQTPIFGGTKHWLGAYPFLCLFAGVGFELVVARLERVFAGRSGLLRVLPLGALPLGALPLSIAVAVLVGPLVMTLGAHPWGLSFYTPLVGGAPGAASLGLNRTFWGYTTGAVADDVNALAPPEGRLYLHDTAPQAFALMRRDGRLRPDLSGTLDIARSELALYHHEPHMRRVEHQLWVTYGTVAPSVVGTYHGVPIVWVYTRPR